MPRQLLMSLTAIAAMSAVATVSAAEASQAEAWSTDPLTPVKPDSEGKFSTEPEPVRIVAPRNGVGSGQVVLRGGDVSGWHVSDLDGPDGMAIAADRVQMRFAADRIDEHDWSFERFEALLDEPPQRQDEHALLPVWLTVTVPDHAEPGEYRGELEIAGLRVPVELQVGGFKVTDPHDWQSLVYLVQSPEAVAWTYGVDLWSPRHFELMGESLKLLGAVGNDVQHITVARRLHFGNDHGMVVFQRDEKGWAPDFRYVDRFLELYDQHVGEPRVLYLYLWEQTMAAVGDRDPAETVAVSVIDENGELSEQEMPIYGSGEADDAWKALIDGMRSRIEQFGWDPSCLMIGTAADNRPEAGTVAFFNKFDPPLQWVAFSHFRGDPISDPDRIVLNNELNVGLAEAPSVPRYPRLRERALKGGAWREEPGEVLWASSGRAQFAQGSAPAQVRWVPDAVMSDHVQGPEAAYRGFTRVGLDGWSAPHPDDGRKTQTLTRFRNHWFRLWRHNPTSIAAPGPAGAVATIRYEMLREGLQEVEARIALERAIEAGALDEADEADARQFLRERNSIRYEADYPDRSLRPGEDWQGTTLRLFELAGDVSSP